MPNDSTTSQPQKIGILLFRRLFFNARGKIRYWLVGGLAGILYGILSGVFPMISVPPINLASYFLTLLIMLPIAQVFPFYDNSILPLAPRLTPLGNFVSTIDLL